VIKKIEAGIVLVFSVLLFILYNKIALKIAEVCTPKYSPEKELCREYR